MGEKVILIIEVDLSCCRCRKKFEEYLCRIRCKYCIEDIIYVDEKNIVRVIGVFCAEELKKKLYCKFRKIITNIRVECKEIIQLTQLINVCIEEHADIKMKIDILRKECVEICKKICGEICKGACEAACKKTCGETCKKTCEETCKKTCEETCKKTCESTCNEVCNKNCNKGCGGKVPCKTECKLNCKCKFSCRCIGICTCICTCYQYTQMQVTMICCASPCPCFVPSFNKYRCCSCGMIGQTPWSGGGPGFFSAPPSWDFQPNCTPGRQPKCPSNYPLNCPPNYIIESQPYCNIM